MAQYGEAGASFIGNDDAHKKWGDNAIVGMLGEQYFADALRRAGLTGSYEVYGSLNIPTPANQRHNQYSSDVDCAVANGNNLLLIDVKRWASGFHYWSIFGFPFKNLTPMTKGNGQWALSGNMAAAVARYRDALPGVNVQAIVVFVPTKSKGMAMPASVGLLRWPGGIRSYLTQDALYKIKSILGQPQPVEGKIRAVLGSMVRRSKAHG